MEPSKEQLEAVAKAIYDFDWHTNDGSLLGARAAWDAIAPIVRAQALEEAAKGCDALYAQLPSGNRANTCANCIRALKSE